MRGHMSAEARALAAGVPPNASAIGTTGWRPLATQPLDRRGEVLERNLDELPRQVVAGKIRERERCDAVGGKQRSDELPYLPTVRAAEHDHARRIADPFSYEERSPYPPAFSV
jgi:tripartite-type tricarboxylate transporter receptor subunit TctC